MSIFLSKLGQKTPVYKLIINIVLLVLLIIAVLSIAIFRVNLSLDFSFILDTRIRILDGFLMTVYISIASLFVSLLLSIISAVLQNSSILVLRYFSIGYVKLIRGTPLITQIYLFFYIIGTAFGVDNRIIAGILILSVFEGAYISEIIRGSLISIDKTQLDAAKSVGFTRMQTITIVIIPQLVARTLPALTGQFASIIKDSSLLSMIAVIELTQTMREISSMNFKLFEAYLFIGVLYLCLTLPISFISTKLERLFNYEY